MHTKQKILTYKGKLSLKPSHIIYSLGLLGFYWYGLTVFIGPDGHLIATGLLVLAFFSYWIRRIWYQFRQNKLFWLSLTLTCYVLLRTLIACLEYPDTISYQIEMGLITAHMCGLPAFLLIPWIINPINIRRIDAFLLIIIISFIANIILTIDANQILKLVTPTNYFYINRHLRMNPNTAGLLVDFLVLGLMTVGIHWLSQIKRNHKIQHFILSTALWTVIVWLLCSILISSESRSAWIALILTITIAIMITLLLCLKASDRFKKSSITFIIIFICFSTITIWINMNQIKEELTKEKESILKVVKGQFNNIPQHSVGKRISAYKFAIQKIIERPILGWGPGTFELLVKNEARNSIKHLKHAHNVILRILFQYGLLGTLIVLFIFFIAIKTVIKELLNNNLPKEWVIFITGSVFMYIIFSQTAPTIAHQQYRYILIFLQCIIFAINIEHESPYNFRANK